MALSERVQVPLSLETEVVAVEDGRAFAKAAWNYLELGK